MSMTLCELWSIELYLLWLFVRKIWTWFMHEQGRRKLQKSGGSRAQKHPKIDPQNIKIAFYCIFTLKFLKVRGVSWPLWPPQLRRPCARNFSVICKARFYCIPHISGTTIWEEFNHKIFQNKTNQYGGVWIGVRNDLHLS